MQFTLPFSEPGLETSCSSSARAAAPAGAGRPKARTLKDFGGKLYGAVFQDELRDALQRGLTLTHAQQAGMRLADNPELAELPWEFPYDLRRAGSCPIAPRRLHRTAEGLSEILRHYL